MRRRLILVFVAVSSMVALAFVVPLGFLVQRTAEDRAMDRARNDVAAVVPSLVAGGDLAQIESAIGATGAGRAGRMTVVTADGRSLGVAVDSPAVDRALTLGTSSLSETSGGAELVTVVATGPGSLSAIRVFVPRDDLQRGQWRAWGTLAAVGLALVGISVVVADRLARAIVRPTEALAVAAGRLGAGDLTTTVEPGGPPELEALGRSFNELGSQVGQMLDHERELIAELSHRLRTPLTKLRMRIDHVDDPALARDLAGDVDEVTRAVNGIIADARGALASSERRAAPEVSDAVAVVTDRAGFWQALAEDQGRPWAFRSTEGPLGISISASDLAAAIDVLLDNACTHTPEETAIQVLVERDEGGHVRIGVEDGGPGLSTDAVERGHSGVASTGLGLSIARRAAEDAGGRLEIGASSLGGAAISLVLPLDRTTVPPR